jgi:hypothetical protein
MLLATEIFEDEMAADRRVPFSPNYPNPSERRESDASRSARREARESYYVFRRGRLEERSFDNEACGW